VAALQALLDDPASGTLLLMHAPTAIVSSADIAAALVPLGRSAPGRLMGCWLGDGAVREARARFRAAGIPCYDRPEEAVRAFSMLVDYRRNQQELLQTPAARGGQAGGDRAAAASLVGRVLAGGREWLSEPEAKQLLAAAGVPVVATRVSLPDADAAVAAARVVGYPVVLKVLSPQILHKSDVGGVLLDLRDDEAVGRAAGDILGRVARLRPDAQVSGFSVQAMVHRPRALELIVGASIDPVFGPVILFGQGGTAVEVVADRSIALPPLNAPLARALVGRTRVARLLAGWRDVPAADLDAIVAVLQSVSDLLAAEPRIAEIDINPLLADAQGVVALDARVRVSAAALGGAEHFAISPYPAHLEETITWQGRTLMLRPIRPEDEDRHRAFLERLDPEDIRLRLFYSRRSIEHTELARMTQIDYAREMAFIATAASPQGPNETLAVVRALRDPDNHDAEFGIVVRSDLKGSGLGERLMRKMVDYLRSQGTRRLVATVLTENHRMLQLARDLGFVVQESSSGVRDISLALN
jgi:acetyltransferase